MPDFYRIVRTNPPTIEDFLPQGRLGKRPRPGADEAFLDSWFNAISVFDRWDGAIDTARKFPGIGRFAAHLLLPEDAPVETQKTGGPGHYDLRGKPEVFLAYVREVVPI